MRQLAVCLCRSCLLIFPLSMRRVSLVTPGGAGVSSSEGFGGAVVSFFESRVIEIPRRAIELIS